MVARLFPAQHPLLHIARTGAIDAPPQRVILFT